MWEVALVGREGRHRGRRRATGTGSQPYGIFCGRGTWDKLELELEAIIKQDCKWCQTNALGMAGSRQFIQVANGPISPDPPVWDTKRTLRTEHTLSWGRFTFLSLPNCPYV